jgi:hypothetical protein
MLPPLLLLLLLLLLPLVLTLGLSQQASWVRALCRHAPALACVLGADVHQSFIVCVCVLRSLSACVRRAHTTVRLQPGHCRVCFSPPSGGGARQRCCGCVSAQPPCALRAATGSKVSAAARCQGCVYGLTAWCGCMCYRCAAGGVCRRICVLPSIGAPCPRVCCAAAAMQLLVLPFCPPCLRRVPPCVWASHEQARGMIVLPQGQQAAHVSLGRA